MKEEMGPFETNRIFRILPQDLLEQKEINFRMMKKTIKGLYHADLEKCIKKNF